MRIRKELWFGFTLMAIIVAGTAVMLLMAPRIENGHLGLMMLALVVVAIMLGFPTAFTLMGMGMIFTWLAYEEDTGKTLTLMVQSAFKVMGNDVLISIPLFVFMGYLVERANLIEKLFKSLHLAMARVPGSLAVATIFTCAVFATATGIVGAVVTLMGLLALPQMLRGGYDVRVSAGSITAGGCLGILIPPSVMLIVYGATAGVSVVQLYAGALFPGLMLAGLYVLYVILLAKIKPHLMPPLSAAQRFVPLPPATEAVAKSVSNTALPALLRALGRSDLGVARSHLWRQLGVTALPLLLVGLTTAFSWHLNTRPAEAEQAPMAAEMPAEEAAEGGGLQEPPAETGGLQEPPAEEGGLKEPPGTGDAASAASAEAAPAAAVAEPPAGVAEAPPAQAPTVQAERTPPTLGWWIGVGVSAVAMLAFYAILSFQRLEIFKMLLQSFFPLVVLIMAVLGSIVFGLATPTEAAAVGAFGGYLLAAVYATVAKRKDKARVFTVWLLLWAPALVSIGWFFLHRCGSTEAPVPVAFGTLAVLGVAIWALMAYKQAGLQTEVKESVFLTAKTSAMVCWLFVGSAIFSAAFALLGGQELVERWVM